MPQPNRSRSANTVLASNFIRTADGTDLFYRDWGTGAPLLFLAGWTLESSMWGYQMQPLSSRFRCIAYDRRGHGRSGDPGRGYDFDTLADDLAMVLDTLGLRQVVVVAHSLASGEIVRYLTRYGTARVAGVVMVAPAAIPYLARTPDNPIGIDPETLRANLAELTEDFPGWAERRSAAYFGGKGSQGIINATLVMMNRTSHQAAVELAHLQASTDFRSELTRLNTPIRFIHGSRDASAPIELTSIPAFSLVRNAEIIVYDNAPHGLYYTEKALLNRDISDFARAALRWPPACLREIDSAHAAIHAPFKDSCDPQ